VNGRLITSFRGRAIRSTWGTTLSSRARAATRTSEICWPLRHLERWLERIATLGARLAGVFDAGRFPHDTDASLSVALWVYENAEKANALLWARRTGETTHLTKGWRGLFD
jgi:hypothetical protein